MQFLNGLNVLRTTCLPSQEARSGFSFSSGGFGARGTPRQLVLLLSDGRFDRENKDRLRSLIGEMNERGQLLVLIGEPGL